MAIAVIITNRCSEIPQSHRTTETRKLLERKIISLGQRRPNKILSFRREGAAIKKRQHFGWEWEHRQREGGDTGSRAAQKQEHKHQRELTGCHERKMIFKNGMRKRCIKT